MRNIKEIRYYRLEQNKPIFINVVVVKRKDIMNYKQSADEAITIFVTCLNCGKDGRINKKNLKL